MRGKVVDLDKFRKRKEQLCLPVSRTGQALAEGKCHLNRRARAFRIILQVCVSFLCLAALAGVILPITLGIVYKSWLVFALVLVASCVADVLLFLAAMKLDAFATEAERDAEDWPDTEPPPSGLPPAA